MKKAEFIALSASSMMLTALGIDVMLPVFGELRTHFGLPHESTETSKIISFFFMGQIAQVVFGVISDRVGRLPVLRLGFPLYIVGGLVAAYAPSLQVMLVARFVAGMGASAVFMITIAAIRDRYSGDQMASLLSLVLTIFLFTPVVAPFLGIWILNLGSWRSVFLSAPLFALIVFVWSFRLKETLPATQRSKAGFLQLRISLINVLGNRVFLRYTVITTLLFSCLSAYVASSEHIVGEIYKRPDLFSWFFAGIGLVMSLSALSNSKLSSLFGARKVLRVMLMVYSSIAIALLIYSMQQEGNPSLAVFFVCVALLLGINLAIEPNSSALALEPMGESAGLASSIYGTFFFFIGSNIGALISSQMEISVFPIVVSFCVAGMLATLLSIPD